MKIEEQHYKILTAISENAEKELRLIEQAGRTCYKSELGDFEKCKSFVRNIIAQGHESVLEHSLLTVKITTARSTSHQLVRHRLCAFSQESQRYCNYSKDKFDNEITVIRPAEFADGSSFDDWCESCLTAEQSYFAMLSKGYKPEVARSVLPNCTKTELVMSANYREWRHIFKERTSSRADPAMRKLMTSLLAELHSKIPVVFDDIKDNSSLHEADKEALIELERLAKTYLQDRQLNKMTFDIFAEDLQFLSANEENEDA